MDEVIEKIKRRCHCPGPDLGRPDYLGYWCGRLAVTGDGLCDRCADVCQAWTPLTDEQVLVRDGVT